MTTTAPTAPEMTTIAVPLDAFAREVMTVHGSPIKSRFSADGMEAVLKFVMELPGVETTADFTPDAVSLMVRWQVMRGNNRATIENLVAEFRRLCEFAISRRYLASNPVDSCKTWVPLGYEPHPAPDDVPEPLTVEDASRLLTRALNKATNWEGHRLYALIATVLYAGLRRDEALSLTVADCDLVAGKLRVAKCAAHRRFRPIPPKLGEILGDWLPLTGCRWAFPGILLRGPWKGGPNGQKPLCRLKALGLTVELPNLNFERLRDFWETRQGRVTLHGEHLTLPTPDTPYGEEQLVPAETPKPIKPPRVAAPPLILNGHGLPVIVLGRQKPPLNRPRYEIVSSLLEAGPEGLSLKQLKSKSGHGGARQLLAKLRESDPDWAKIIIPAERAYGRYRLAEPAEPAVALIGTLQGGNPGKAQ